MLDENERLDLEWLKAMMLYCGSSHQTHYEQWGELWGTFVAEGQPSHQLHLRGYHDHSYGWCWNVISARSDGLSTHTHTHTHDRFMALCPGIPG